MKAAHVVALEALVIGLCLALMVYAGTLVVPRWSTMLVALVCGAIFHVVCEVTGINAWYARTYPSIVR